MRNFTLKVLAPALIGMLLLSGCNLPSSQTPSPADIQDTAVAMTLSAMGTAAVQPTGLIATVTGQTPQPPVITETSAVQATSTPQDPLVVKDALCWEGPGSQYEVVSSVFTGTRVKLLGRGSIGSWWIIDNPRYHDPCWLMADVLEFDPGFNLSGLQVFNPPPTPTFTPTPVPTSTWTPTP